VASRRRAEELIKAGRVSVDGHVVTELGTRVDPERASIRVDGKLVRRQPLRYFILNKPSGFITTTSDERDRRTVMELLPPVSGLYPVGRLDRDTEGLLLFTNDGDVANRVMHPRYGLTKEYLVLTPEKPRESVMRSVRSGVDIDGRIVVPDEFRIVRETAEGVLLSIVLHEGLNRVVRRIMDAAGIEIDSLRRVRVGPLSIAGIPRGASRELTAGELTSLFQALHIVRGQEGTARPGSGKPLASRVDGSTRRGPSRLPRRPADDARS
jgi:23S rRNA pseudouridine2605 synthase